VVLAGAVVVRRYMPDLRRSAAKGEKAPAPAAQIAEAPAAG
jgi:hypothetical protein